MICQHTGWTWDYVDENMTMERLNALTGYWEDHPPLQAMIASYFGIESKPKETKTDFINAIAHLPVTRKIE